MKLIQYFGTALCVVILSCVTNIIPGTIKRDRSGVVEGNAT
jgi:hypothetical protein